MFSIIGFEWPRLVLVGLCILCITMKSSHFGVGTHLEKVVPKVVYYLELHNI